MNDTVLTVFVVVTALAVVLQAGILAGMFFAMRKTSAKVESLAARRRTGAVHADRAPSEDCHSGGQR